MKRNQSPIKQSKTYADVLSRVLEKVDISEDDGEILQEYGGQILQPPQEWVNNGYYPATIQRVKPPRLDNPAVPMGQSDLETKSPKTMPYPLDAIFELLASAHLNLNNSYKLIKDAERNPVLNDAELNVLTQVSDSLEDVINKTKELAKKIEQINLEN